MAPAQKRRVETPQHSNPVLAGDVASGGRSRVVAELCSASSIITTLVTALCINRYWRTLSMYDYWKDDHVCRIQDRLKCLETLADEQLRYLDQWLDSVLGVIRRNDTADRATLIYRIRTYSYTSLTNDELRYLSGWFDRVLRSVQDSQNDETHENPGSQLRSWSKVVFSRNKATQETMAKAIRNLSSTSAPFSRAASDSAMLSSSNYWSVPIQRPRRAGWVSSFIRWLFRLK